MWRPAPCVTLVLRTDLVVSQDEGDYLCVKVLRHSKSKKTMVRKARISFHRPREFIAALAQGASPFIASDVV